MPTERATIASRVQCDTKFTKGSGPVQVWAEPAEQHQVCGGKLLPGKLFKRLDPPLLAISPPLANQTHGISPEPISDHVVVIGPARHHDGVPNTTIARFVRSTQ